MKDIFSILPKDKVFYNEPMNNHTTFKIGGPSDVLFCPTRIHEVIKCINLCKKNNINFYILGNGSNILVKDDGYRGVIIKTTGINSIDKQMDMFYIGAGQSLENISNYFLEHEYTGFEFACGIPGSFGGAIYMNGGAYGSEIKDVVQEVSILKDDKIVTYTNDQMQFGYRTSVIKNTDLVILGASLKLEKGNYLDIKEKIDDLTYRRESKQPLEYPSAGSVFKRPSGDFAGRLIQESNLQGVAIGGAKVSEKHAGFIINYNNATAQDVIDLILYIQHTVNEKFNIMLERELIIL